MQLNDKPLSYKDSGVDIDAGNALVENIKPLAQSTKRPGVMGSLGGFGGCFEIPKGYSEPVLVSGTDGVGTKLRLAIDLERYEGIGIDLVAMCANDLIVMGAEPLFFLDYYATGKLDIDVATKVIAGIAKGCIEAGCALIGGETAEMPGMYHDKDFDLAGFCVGVVEKSKVIDGSSVKVGDHIIALASSGPHSNGYSLIRKVLERVKSNNPALLTDNQESIYEQLMAPTKLYIKSLLSCYHKGWLKACAHITGGGFWENIPRVLPAQLCAHISSDLRMPDIFKWLQTQGQISMYEMYRTFNCGVGMICVVDPKDSAEMIAHLNSLGEQAWHIGEITPMLNQEQVVIDGIQLPLK